MIVSVTVTFNGATVLEPFLACYRAQENVDHFLVIVDNASTDGTGAILDAITDPNIVLIRNDHNIGVAAANNQGIEEGLRRGADRIVLINNDTEFGSDLLARMADSLNDNDASAVSPLIPYFDDPDKIWFGGGHFARRRGIRVVHDHEKQPLSVVGASPFAIDYAPTCCVMFEAAVFAKIGTMDERYFVYWDDVDFMWRMKQVGLKLVLDPTIRLLHKVSISTGGRLSEFSIKYKFPQPDFLCAQISRPAMERLYGRHGDSVRRIPIRDATGSRPPSLSARQGASPRLRDAAALRPHILRSIS